ncbi:MAG: hypothetical protein LBS97_00695 [Treponema sp.]|jgi:hypothetical protein|nr:hypothetical protein [Treponema sp.]
MKNCILALGKYFIVFALGLLTGLAGYYLYLASSSFSAGGALVFPQITVVYPMIPFFSLAAVILTCICLITRIARQNRITISSALICISLSLFTWLAAMPFGSRTLSELSPVELVPYRNQISPGYFRRIDSVLYYYFQINQDNTGTGILFDIDDRDGMLPVFTPQVNVPLHFDAGDTLITDTLRIPRALSILYNLVDFFQKNGRQAIAQGYIPWILFASLFLPVIALLALSHCSMWKLINFAFISLGFAGIFGLHRLYFYWRIPDQLSLLTETVFSSEIIKKVPPELISYIPLCFVNILLSLSIVIFGVRGHSQTKLQTWGGGGGGW